MNDAALEQIEESLRGHESLSEVDDFNALTKKYIENGDALKKARGDLDGKVAIPGDDASDEDRAKFFTEHLGRPETADKYELAKPENLPESMVYDEAGEQLYRGIVHKYNLSDKAAKGIYSDLQAYAIEMHNKAGEAVREANEKQVETLKGIWPGDEFDKNNRETQETLARFAEVRKVPEGFGGLEGLKNWLVDSANDISPVFNWLIHEFFSAIGDDKFVMGKTSEEKGTSQTGGLDFNMKT